MYDNKIVLGDMVKWVDEYYSHSEYANSPFFDALVLRCVLVKHLVQQCGKNMKISNLIKSNQERVILFKRPKFLEEWLEIYRVGSIKPNQKEGILNRIYFYSFIL